MVEIGTISLYFQLDPYKVLDPSLVASCSGALLVQVEGQFDLYLDGNLFLSVEQMPLLELGVQLLEWHTEITNGELADFVYESIEWAGEPVLQFSRCSACWRINSVWETEISPRLIRNDNLIKAVVDFLRDLDSQLRELHHLDMASFSTRARR